MHKLAKKLFTSLSIKRNIIALGAVISIGALVGTTVLALPAGSPPDVISLPSQGSSYVYTNPQGGRVTITAAVINPTAHSTQVCDGARQRPNFTYRLQDTGVVFGATSSYLTYDLDIGARSCADNVSAYAIYSPTFCELAGYYGSGENGRAFDCRKYIANVPDNEPNQALGCAVNASGCVVPRVFNIISKKSGRNPPYAPGSSLEFQTLDDYRLPKDPGEFIGGLGKDTTSNGQRNFDAEICQYWNKLDGSNNPTGTTSATNPNDDDCKSISFNISWTYTPPPPSYQLRADISAYSGTFSYYETPPAGFAFGATTNAAAYLTPDIGAHNIDLFRVTYDGNPPGWGAGTLTYNDNGLCDAVTGEASCDRVEALTCPNSGLCQRGGITGPNQSWSYGYSSESGSHDAGKIVCYISRVSKPNQSAPDNEWITSARQCVKSVKKPRAQFVGSDLRVGGVIQSSPYTVRGNYYGSWGEYGVLSGGGNFLAGSGNAFRTPSTSGGADISKLTFRNDDQTNLGYYEGLRQSTAFDDFRGLTDTGPAITAPPTTTGVYNYTPGTLGRLNATTGGSSIIIKHSGTLRITDNITVPNNGVTNANALSQVVIVADNIEIAPNVTQVDAWLLANPTGGFINTCSDLSTLTTGVCSNFLQVNGPILTDRLYLRRTAGANLPEANIKDPAEKFNLRPDAQLWAYSYANKADFAQTDYVQELPPRY